MNQVSLSVLTYQSHDRNLCFLQGVGERQEKRKVGRVEVEGMKQEGEKRVCKNQCFANCNGHVNHLGVLLRQNLIRSCQGLRLCGQSEFLRSSCGMLPRLVQDPRVRSQALDRRTFCI